MTTEFEQWIPKLVICKTENKRRSQLEENMLLSFPQFGYFLLLKHKKRTSQRKLFIFILTASFSVGIKETLYFLFHIRYTNTWTEIIMKIQPSYVKYFVWFFEIFISFYTLFFFFIHHHFSLGCLFVSESRWLSILYYNLTEGAEKMTVWSNSLVSDHFFLVWHRSYEYLLVIFTGISM